MSSSFSDIPSIQIPRKRSRSGADESGDSGQDQLRKGSLNPGFIQSFSNTNNFDFGGRSYVGMTQRSVSISNLNPPVVYSGPDVHEQTANLANIGVTDDDHIGDDDEDELVDIHSGFDYDYASSFPSPANPSEADATNQIDIETPLLTSNSPQKSYVDEQLPDLESGISRDASNSSRLVQLVLTPFNYLPAVFLGTLLNILDGLSYGMIMFPISEGIFASLGPAGLSMFYMSCIISQLVYSFGGSAFKLGIGSEMIEVTPFFHSMALSIMNDMQGASSDAIIATTIVSYAFSSIVTGLVFFILGKCKLGSLVGFFPRHILVGCIGGVGYFLIVTGIEVSSRLEGGLFYNWPTLSYLIKIDVFLQWFTPLLLAILLVFLQHKIHNSLLVPLYFIAVFVIFHAIIALFPNLSLDSARKSGWLFPAVEDNQPWYAFYKLYKFQLVDWWAVLSRFPTMLALTFFGILHVPINVPALAVSVGMDQFDVDRELVAHGYSNALSGLVGSIQNYLVYTNSVLFIRAGADDRLAGILLAVGTGAIMMAGPVVIGYIPICVVGALIFLLGYELLKESVYDTWGKLRKIEYSTIIIIVVVMGVWDFVYGILVGILLACLSFVVEAARRSVVRGIYTGTVARSTVLRHPKQQEFLKDVGDQIVVIKLQGTVFFGSIGGVENAIRKRFDDDKFKKDPIKFLIIDMKGVSSIDFSAAEGFRRILNLTNEFETQLVISSVVDDDDIVIALRDAGLWDTNNELDIQLFNTLNYALEWCENCFLKTYKRVKRGERRININTNNRQMSPSLGQPLFYDNSPVPIGNTPGSSGSNRYSISQALDGTFGTPRTTKLYQAATKTAKDEQSIQNKYYRSTDSAFKKQPLPLLMITFNGLSDKDEEFWSKLTPFLIKETIPTGITFYDTSYNAPSFFIIESGLIRSIVRFESDERELHSSILPNTAFGDLNEKSKLGQNFRDMTYTTVTDTVAWRLSESKVTELLTSSDGIIIYNELLQVQARLIKERFDTMTANLVLSA